MKEHDYSDEMESMGSGLTFENETANKKTVGNS
jgi:hypothetical protein